LILKSTGAGGVGVAGYSTGDFGSGSAPTKIPSGAHYPQQAASVQTWANWYDSAGPSLATVNVDGTCTAMTLRRGTPTNGASATVTGVGTGCHRYYFNFRDASGTSRAIRPPARWRWQRRRHPDWDSSRPPVCDRDHFSRAGEYADIDPDPDAAPIVDAHPHRDRYGDAVAQPDAEPNRDTDPERDAVVDRAAVGPAGQRIRPLLQQRPAGSPDRTARQRCRDDGVLRVDGFVRPLCAGRRRD
jgi:hypothetical protein